MPFVGLLAAYNYLRFGNILDQGYGLQSIAGNLSADKSLGLFGLVHVPGNLYYLLLAGPIAVFREEGSHILTFPYLKADPWGLGLIFTSPYLFYLLLLDYKDKFSWRLILTIVSIALPIVTYYGIGWYQFGYRYSLDFLPWLFLLFLRNYRLKFGNLAPLLRVLIILSAFANFYLFAGIFSI